MRELREPNECMDDQSIVVSEHTLVAFEAAGLKKIDMLVPLIHTHTHLK